MKTNQGKGGAGDQAKNTCTSGKQTKEISYQKSQDSFSSQIPRFALSSISASKPLLDAISSSQPLANQFRIAAMQFLTRSNTTNSLQSLANLIYLAVFSLSSLGFLPVLSSHNGSVTDFYIILGHYKSGYSNLRSIYPELVRESLEIFQHKYVVYYLGLYLEKRLTWDLHTLLKRKKTLTDGTYFRSDY